MSDDQFTREIISVLESDPRFSNIHAIGVGGMGRVFRAFDSVRGELIALKTIRTPSADALYRFKTEFRTLADIAHPNLCSLFDLSLIGGRWFIAMQYVDGVDVISYLRQRRSDVSLSETSQPNSHSNGTQNPGNDSTVTLDSERTSIGAAESSALNHFASSSSSHIGYDPLRLCSVFRQIADGIQHLHSKGVMHRDLKPSNVLVTADGEVLVLDFGLASVANRYSEEFDSSPLCWNQAARAELTQLADQPQTASGNSDHLGTMAFAGTGPYMAPEQIQGNSNCLQSDWYSLGVMLYECLTGVRPFDDLAKGDLTTKCFQDPPPPAALVPEIPNPLNDLCKRLLHRDPNQRAGFDEVANSLSSSRSQNAMRQRQYASLFVGRDTQLRSMYAEAEDARDGHIKIIELTGGSGIGKSGLLAQFGQLLTDTDYLQINAKCFEQESVPYKALDNVVDLVTSQLLRMLPDERKTIIGPNIEFLAQLFPVMLRIPEVRTLTPEPELRTALRREPADVRRLAMESLAQLLEGLADGRAIWLCIDDVHWGDAISAELLGQLLHGLVDRRILLTLAYRSESELNSPFLRHWQSVVQRMQSTCTSTKIELSPLTRQESLALVDQVLARGLPDRELVIQRIVDEGRGLPFYTTELALEVDATPAVSLAAELTEAARQPDRGSSMLDQWIGRRADSCSAAARELLSVVSLAGVPMRLSAALQSANGPSPRDIHELRAKRFIRLSGPGTDAWITCYHDRVRESIAQQLGFDEAAVIHSRLGATLESRGEGDSEMLAIHFRLGQQLGKAAHYSELAADEAAHTLAFGHASQLYQSCIALHQQLGTKPSVELRGKLAHCLAQVGQNLSAARLFEDVSAESSGDVQLHYRTESARLYCTAGYLNDGLQQMRLAFRDARLKFPENNLRSVLGWLVDLVCIRYVPRLPFLAVPPTRLATLVRQLKVLWSASTGLSAFDLVRAGRITAQYTRLAKWNGIQDGWFRGSLRVSAQVRSLSAGWNQYADQLIENARPVADELSKEDSYAKAYFLIGVALKHCLNCQWSISLRVFEQAIEAFELCRVEYFWERSSVVLFQSVALFYTGQYREMQAISVAEVDRSIERGDIYSQLSLCSIGVGFGHLVDDQAELADRLVETLRPHLPKDMYSLQHLFVWYTELYIALYRNDPAAAYMLLQSGLNQLYRSQLMHDALISATTWQICGRVAVLCLEHNLHVKWARNTLNRSISKLRKSRLREFRAWASLLELNRRAETGKQASEQEIGTVIDQLRDADLQAYANCLAHRSFQMGFSADRAAPECAEWFERQRIANVDAFVRLHCPGRIAG